MRILIGYSMRSGSTLLQHILDGHSALDAYGDLSSIPAFWRCRADRMSRRHVCIKPMDVLYLQQRLDFYRHFDRLVWLARDPRDSYLSTIESGYAYLLWPRGELRDGIDLGLLRRWQRIYRHYFEHPDRWYLVRYEDLVSQPVTTVSALLDHLGLSRETLFPFPRFKRHHGGDYKITEHQHVTANSRARYLREMSPAQVEVFDELLGDSIRALGYASDQAQVGLAYETRRARR
ncbi:MAG TPA: sulfotransferase [Thioalkalivibrio sp.]|nr:sulfotransferase [Thioalkalivibrio sp.]